MIVCQVKPLFYQWFAELSLLVGLDYICLQLKLKKKRNFHAYFPGICRFNGLETQNPMLQSPLFIFFG